FFSPSGDHGRLSEGGKGSSCTAIRRGRPKNSTAICSKRFFFSRIKSAQMAPGSVCRIRSFSERDKARTWVNKGATWGRSEETRRTNSSKPALRGTEAEASAEASGLG